MNQTGVAIVGAGLFRA